MKLENARTSLQPLQNEQYNKQMATAKDKAFEKSNELHHEEAVTIDKVKTVVDKLNEFIEPLQTNLKFEFREKPRRILCYSSKPING